MPRPNARLSELSTLTVRDRFEAAVHAYRQDYPTSQPSIALICRLAGLSRANIYATYPDLVASVHSSRMRTQRAEELPVRDRRCGACAAKDEENKRLKALLYVCLELRAEVESLRALRVSIQKRQAAHKRLKR